MADSDITVSGLRVEAASSIVVASWSFTNPSARRGLSYLALEQVEVWASLTSDTDPTTGEMIAEGRTFSVCILDPGTWYVWARARDVSGNYGDWSPSSGGLQLITPGRIPAVSTLLRPALHLIPGIAPDAPNTGDIWFDGTDLKFRKAGSTKTFDLS